MKQVVIVVPPNSNQVLPGLQCTVTNPEEHSDWSDYASLGALSLCSSIDTLPAVRAIYIDGTIVDLNCVLQYIADCAEDIIAVCVSVLTANYEAGLAILRAAKVIRSSILTVAGNDHFTALPLACMTHSPEIDVGFVGNEIVGSFTRYVGDLAAGSVRALSEYPGIVGRDAGRVVMVPQRTEPINQALDYSIQDRAFNHSALYRQNFATRVAPRMKQLLGRQLSAGVPVEIGRGCIKFASNDACSFCSIQYGGQWRNQLDDAASAWDAILRPVNHGYDYLYLTADELPLTFNALLKSMRDEKPSRWTAVPDDERPVIVGYARADGIADEARAQILRDIGVRQVMIGMDAGSPVSLAAMNKPLTPRRQSDLERRADKLFEQNLEALRIARSVGLVVRVGFVIGHIGMNEYLLRKNLDAMKFILQEGADVISALDVEVLSPQPGSLDFQYLVQPDMATARASQLKLEIASSAEREEFSQRFRGSDRIDRESAMIAYIGGLMPVLSLVDLATARGTIRSFAKDVGVVIGEAD